MKKSLFIMAVCAAALTGCTSNEVIEEGPHSNAIGFQQVVNKESRALDKTNLKFFSVYGYYTTDNDNTPVNVFNGTDVTRADVATNNWDYSPKRYWVPGATYRFYAYACEGGEFATANGTAALGTGNDIAGRALRLRNVKIDGAHQHDLIYAKNDDGIKGAGEETNTNAPVAFQFKHILTRLNVVFSSGFPEGYTIEISDVELKNFNDYGNYNPANGWAVDNDNASQDGSNEITLSLTEGATTAVASATEANVKKVTTGIAYVIPYQYSDADDSDDEPVILSFNVDIKNANGESIVKNALEGTWYPKWAEGYSYTYNVRIDGSAAALYPIVFETAVDVNDWAEGTTNSVEMVFGAN